MAVLVVEDEFYLADDIALALTAAGANVLGPLGRVEDALRLVSAEQKIDFAILDVDLGGDRVFPVADLLLAQGTPFLFATGYDANVIPQRFAGIRRLEKPVSPDAIVHLLLSSLPG